MQGLELSYKEITDKDIDLVGEWLKGWHLTPIERSNYPDTGLVLFDKVSGESIYMGFVWCTNSKLAQIGFVTRNPFFKTKLPKDTRKKFLFELIGYAKSLGFTTVMTWAENQLLVNDFKELGMLETSDKCSELIAKI